MTKLYYVMQNDQAISSIIWPAFKDTLEEKHGGAGKLGARGEDDAAMFLQNEKYFPDLNVVIKHEDALHQLIGIDFTTVDVNGFVNYIDVKTGSSSLYWDKEKRDWFITFNPDWFTNTRKKTEYIMHIGPKGDVFAFYSINKMIEWGYNNKTLFTQGKYNTILYKQFWNKDLIQTNLW